MLRNMLDIVQVIYIYSLRIIIKYFSIQQLACWITAPFFLFSRVVDMQKGETGSITLYDVNTHIQNLFYRVNKNRYRANVRCSTSTKREREEAETAT